MDKVTTPCSLETGSNDKNEGRLFNELKNLKPKSILEKNIAPLVEIIAHATVMDLLLQQVEKIDYRAVAFPDVCKIEQRIDELNQLTTNADGSINKELFEVHRHEINQLKNILKNHKLKENHYLIITIEQLIELAKRNEWGLCKNHSFVYIYNGTYWSEVDKNDFEVFLGRVAEKMGVKEYEAKFYQFHEKIFKQFLATAHLSTPKPDTTTAINLQNGTFEITQQGTRLREFNYKDFFTYQLPFAYEPTAKAPLFEAYLNRCLPDLERQNVIAEYLGYIFLKNGALKLEKVLILYGSGANGKSVMFEIINALLGNANVTNYSFQELTNDNGYYRAKIANVLVNYASEINGKLESSIMKKLASGEAVSARLPYGEPFQLSQYAKLIFNCNELPKDVEHSNAYFRRFLIIPFDVTIPEHEQDKDLHTKIIANELAGVFNWILAGLQRLLANRKFSECNATRLAVEQYKKESDSVAMFVDESGIIQSTEDTTRLQSLYAKYRTYCSESGSHPVAIRKFSERLRHLNFVVNRAASGNLVFAQEKPLDVF
jgi:putative DNA primase/helicase